jgi:hypothetical protein
VTLPNDGLDLPILSASIQNSDKPLEFRLPDRAGVVHRFPLQRKDATTWRARPVVAEGHPRVLVRPGGVVFAVQIWRAALVLPSREVFQDDTSPGGALRDLEATCREWSIFAEDLVPGIAA